MTTTTAEKLAVMQAYERGEKIESSTPFPDDFWKRDYKPTWDWRHLMYRIAVPEPIPHTIDWSHVKEGYNWLFTDGLGQVVISGNEPKKWGKFYCHDAGFISVYAQTFASFNKGNMPWEDSLVVRPKQP